MTKKVLRAAVVAALCSYLAGCSWLGSTFSNEKVQYESSDSRTDLQVPPDIDAIPSNDRYTVPTRPQIVSANAEAAKREIDIQNKGGAGNVLPETHIATVERDGNLRYVHVKLAPDKVWPTLQDFWSGMGLTLKAQDPKAGYMVTEWAENKANLPQDIIRKTIGKVIDMVYDTGERDQYRLSVERNDDGTSDIFISHRQMVEVLKGKDGDTTVWQPGPSDPQLEGLMLTKLAQKIEAEFNPDAKPEEQKQVEALAATKYVPMSSVVKDAKGEAQAATGAVSAWRWIVPALTCSTATAAAASSRSSIWIRTTKRPCKRSRAGLRTSSPSPMPWIRCTTRFICRATARRPASRFRAPTARPIRRA